MGRLNYLWKVSIKETYSNQKPIYLNVVAENILCAVEKALASMETSKNSSIGTTWEVVAAERGEEVDLV